MAGRLFAIVGPSGVGKDTLMGLARARRPDLRLVRRVITRDPQAGGEDFEPVTQADFARRLQAGAFALHWQAHGLSYGIPCQIDDWLDEGRDVLFNGSRAVLGRAMARYPGLRVLHVTARPETLARRLARRGRESAQDIAARLARADYALPAGLAVTRIDNDGPLEAAVAAMMAALYPERV
ncbi:phosphonate metabolism protein/1,5-bisphosphokinase (PRPP-forming) PhnN [Rhodovulum adriaticum]|uniref:Ribose 1,5-bisphosphate phosphokinase PhnN n=1 Tax=Rhodovulum adriaticum TaxID=35804 RepID=A0A4R2NNL0_RHOAD|nr:phosphonate metabolism protein/1,5-bisphosphokinase (PRPP-forming) PhnN [Rhodovulum adriaticum]MBK1634468.1 phosphonate metabolism protein/1,5-bisphosphokinase (PRPP-forming) PhnN [Rhodovulum adriaticum]TCP23162.1 ribose 1,5-bisphosphokinase [Rhodovulum adriaticum]